MVTKEEKRILELEALLKEKDSTIENLKTSKISKRLLSIHKDSLVDLARVTKATNLSYKDTFTIDKIDTKNSLVILKFTKAIEFTNK